MVGGRRPARKNDVDRRTAAVFDWVGRRRRRQVGWLPTATHWSADWGPKQDRESEREKNNTAERERGSFECISSFDREENEKISEWAMPSKRFSQMIIMGNYACLSRIEPN